MDVEMDPIFVVGFKLLIPPPFRLLHCFVSTREYVCRQKIAHEDTKSDATRHGSETTHRRFGEPFAVVIRRFDLYDGLI